MNISESQRRFEILQKEIEEAEITRKVIGNIDSFVDLGLDDMSMSANSDMEVIEE